MIRFVKLFLTVTLVFVALVGICILIFLLGYGWYHFVISLNLGGLAKLGMFALPMIFGSILIVTMMLYFSPGEYGE